MGNLKIRDVSKPVTFKVKYKGTVKDPWGNQKAGWTATTTINRFDYGLNWSKALETGGLVVGKEVEIALNVEGQEISSAAVAEKTGDKNSSQNNQKNKKKQ